MSLRHTAIAGMRQLLPLLPPTLPLRVPLRPAAGARDLVCEAQRWFADSPAPRGALAALWLRAGYWDQAHQVAQNDHSAEGSYWHGILHRLEGDYWNAGYWMARVGRHAALAAIDRRMQALRETEPGWGSVLGHGRYDPKQLVSAVETALAGEDAGQVRLVSLAQQAEWEGLFAYCSGMEWGDFSDC